MHRAAAAAGYTRSQHFVAAFRAFHGITPGQVRRAARLARSVKRLRMVSPPPSSDPKYLRSWRSYRDQESRLLRTVAAMRRDTPLHQALVDDLRRYRRPDYRTTAARRQRTGQQLADARDLQRLLAEAQGLRAS